MKALPKNEVNQAPARIRKPSSQYNLFPVFKTMAKEHHDFTFIDLFAGIGGLRLGFEHIGGHCIFTSEWDSYAQKTYATNFQDDQPIAGDITKIDASEIPDHDVLLAGFPCQPFSIAGVSKKNSLGKPHGFECTAQGTLFFDVARIIAEKRPKAFLLENVKNLLSHDKGNTFAVIKDILENQLGYHVTYRVIDAQHFVPQQRKRIMIVGFRDKVDFDWDAMPLAEIGVNTPKLHTILHKEDGSEEDIDEGRFISKNGKIIPKYVLTDNLWEYLQAYAKKHKEKGNGFGCSVVEAFLRFSLSVQNRRKSRAGSSLENHLEYLFECHNVKYARNSMTEAKSRPDFLFPGNSEYHNPNYPNSSLTMLGVKSTCKDRWRQILKEANRIENKHLFTLQPSISENQLKEMQSANVQLVLPQYFHASYTTAQKKSLMNMQDFINMVKNKQKLESFS